ncbi:MAG: hypothetical protein JWN00_503 [Actinomycetia bacterium]|nr:hypothetical protein [Actinomycetes bacterium]
MTPTPHHNGAPTQTGNTGDRHHNGRPIRHTQAIASNGAPDRVFGRPNVVNSPRSWNEVTTLRSSKRRRK